MYTDPIVKAFLAMVTFGNWLGSIPYHYDNVKEKLYIHFWSHFRLIHFWSWVTAYVAVTLPTHLYQLYTAQKFKKFNYILVLLIYGIICFVMLGVLSFNTMSICQFVNGFWKFLPYFENKLFKTRTRNKRKRTIDLLAEMASMLLCGGCILCAAIAGIHSFVRPQEPTYLLFGIRRVFMSWPLILVASGWFTNYVFGCACVFYLFCLHWILYFVYFMPIIRYELRKGLPTYKTRLALRLDPYLLVTTWKSIEIMMKSVNIEIGFILAYLEVLFELSTIIAIVSLVYQWELYGIFIRAVMCIFIFVGTVVWPIALTLAGIHYKWTKDTLNSWKPKYWWKRSEQEYMEKIKKSCAPFSLGNGGGYFITPLSTPNYLIKLGINCATVLITYGKLMG